MEIEFALTLLIIFAAFFGESLFGFGGGLIAIPLLSLILGVKDAVTLVLVFQFLMGILILKNYKSIDWKVATPMTYTLVIGVIAGTLLLSGLGTAFLQLFLAAIIILFLVKSEFFGTITLGKGKNNLYGSIAGLAGGLLQGLIGAGGPILTMYTSTAIEKKIAIRATLIYLFFIPNILRMAISVPQHLFTDQIIHLSLLALPLFALAIYLGQRTHHFVNEKHYRLSINIVLTFSALALLIKAL